MPAKSKAQQRLMSMAYACKTGKSGYCPPKIKKLADSISTKDLSDFAHTSQKDLPERVGESIVYKLNGSNGTTLTMFKDWLTKKDIQFVENDGEFEILNNYDLSKDDKHQMLDFVQKIGLKKVWENAGTPADGAGAGFATLSNTIGAKFVNPPGPGKVGSGDRFDNMIGGTSPVSWLKTKKKKPVKDPEPPQHVKSLHDFLKVKKSN